MSNITQKSQKHASSSLSELPVPDINASSSRPLSDIMASLKPETLKVLNSYHNEQKLQPKSRIPCPVCKKTFTAQKWLDQHLQDSERHLPKTKEAPKPLAIQLSKPEVPAQDDTEDITSSLKMIAIEESKQDVPASEQQWSTIPKSDFPTLLNTLSNSCHKQDDLRINKYVLHPSMSEGSGEHPDEYSTFAVSPLPSLEKPVIKAIAIDCEMVKVVGPKKELVLICAMDYLTGEVLMNRLVAPTSEVIDWKTQIHGISASSMADAVSSGEAVTGWEAARAELWKLIDQDTILVGHALQHDLKVLHIIHTRIVDSAILTANEIGMGTNQLALKTLAKELLDVEIRKNETGAHDALEDVLATREIILWCTRNPQQFDDWGVQKRAEIRRREEERRAARKKPAGRKPKQPKPAVNTCPAQDDHAIAK